MIRPVHSHHLPCSSLEQQSRDDERGAILILLVILSVSLLVITGLAIDTGLMAASRAQHRQTSELLALRALREYISSPATTPVNKLLDAREKAQALLGMEVFLAQPFRAEPGLGDEIGPMDSALTNGPSGSILPGIWHFRPEIDATSGQCVGATPCPCTTGGEFAGACFEAIDLNDGNNFEPDINGQPKLKREINAIRADLRLRDESPMKTVFARVGGGDPTYTIQSASTAAVFPTHAMFLLPLTRYAHMETHIPYERDSWTTTPASYNPVESAYHLEKTAGKIQTCVSAANPCDKLPGIPPYTPNCDFEGGLFPDLYNALYVYGSGVSSMLIPKTRGPSVLNTKHYKSDFACYNTDYDENGSNKKESFIVDSYRRAGTTTAAPGEAGYNGYDGPEPLTTYLATMNYALNLIYQRNIPGDRIGLLAFDQSTDVDKRKVVPAATDSDSFKKLLRVTDVDVADTPNSPPSPATSTLHDSDYDGDVDPAAARLVERVQDTMLFVRADAQANIPAALDQARLMLINETANPSLVENTVVLLSNGMSNCVGSGPTDCGRDQNTFVVPSINASIDFVNQYYVPDNIKFHMVTAGDMILPHTVARKGGTGATANSCMSEQESKELGYDYVNWGVDPLPSATNPTGFPGLVGPAILNTPQIPKSPTAPYFYYPNRLYEAVRATGGTWSPLRDPCTPSATVGLAGGLNCEQGGLKAGLDAKCAGVSALGGTANNIPDFTDSEGRLYCDIYCRSRRAQGTEAVDKIFSRSPFVLVE